MSRASTRTRRIYVVLQKCLLHSTCDEVIVKAYLRKRAAEHRVREEQKYSRERYSFRYVLESLEG